MSDIQMLDAEAPVVRRPIDLVNGTAFIDAALLWAYKRQIPVPTYPRHLKPLQVRIENAPVMYDNTVQYQDTTLPHIMQEAWYAIREALNDWTPVRAELAISCENTADPTVPLDNDADASVSAESSPAAPAEHTLADDDGVAPPSPAAPAAAPVVNKEGEDDDTSVEFAYPTGDEVDSYDYDGNTKFVLITLTIPQIEYKYPEDRRDRFTSNDLVMVSTGTIAQLAHVKKWTPSDHRLTLELFKGRWEDLGLHRDGPHQVYFKKCYRISTALVEIDGLKSLIHKASTKVIYHLLHATLPCQNALPTFTTEAAMRCNPSLNAPQAVAVERVARAKGFSIDLIRGPPGTGKTTTVVGLIKRLKIAHPAGKAKILVVAPSHVAVDNVLEKLIADNTDLGLNILRLGRRVNIRDSVLPRSLYEVVKSRSQPFLAAERQAEEAYQNVLRHGTDEEVEAAREAKTAAHDQFIEARGVQRTKALEEADIVGSTLTACYRVAEEYQWDAIIIDEACQATEPSTLLALLGASEHTKVVLVGDPKQLAPTVLNKAVNRAGLGRSLFERFLANYKRAPVSFLSLQYRMDREIAETPSRLFYKGELTTAIDRPNPPWRTEKMLGAYRFFNVLSMDDDTVVGHSRCRPPEIQAILGLLRAIPPSTSGNLPPEIGVIAPYAAQRALIQQKFDLEGINRNQVEVNTIDGFQGREKDIIILSLVRCGNEIGFMGEPKRINVGITRARSAVWFVGDWETWCKPQYWKTIVGETEVYDYEPTTNSFAPHDSARPNTV